MEPEIRLLCDRMRQTIGLLDRVSEHHWAGWLREALSRIEQDDFYGIERVLSAYGGMGSFNDLLIHPLNGHSGTEVECAAVNERLDTLRTEVYDLAQAVRRAYLRQE